MEAGFTFVLAEDVVDKHLWIVLSDPSQFPDQVVIVSFTTYTPQKDQACIVEKDEHPSWFRHRSCISYTHTKIVTLEQIRTLRNNGSLLPQEPLSEGLLTKIRERAGDSTTMLSHIADILEEQGIIRLDAYHQTVFPAFCVTFHERRCILSLSLDATEGPSWQSIL